MNISEVIENQTELDHYELLAKTADSISQRVGIPIKVEPSSYWIGGRQQTDCYDIQLPWSTTGPMNFWFAYGWLEGYGAIRPTGTDRMKENEHDPNER